MSVEAVYNEGFQLRCEGQYRQARAAFERVIAQEPSHVQARWQLALIQGFEGDFEGSLEALKALAEEEPENQDVLNDLGMTYMMLGFTDEACVAFRRLIAVNPDHENANRQIVYCG